MPQGAEDRRRGKPGGTVPPAGRMLPTPKISRHAREASVSWARRAGGGVMTSGRGTGRRRPVEYYARPNARATRTRLPSDRRGGPAAW